MFMIMCMLILGFYRDFVFKNINALLQARDHNMDYAMPRSLNFISNYEYTTIVNIKWLLTLVFSLLYLGISIAVIRFMFHNRNYNRITIASYAGIIIVSAVLITAGLLFKSTSEKMYEFARYLMGMAQSPIVVMILIPAFKIAEKEKTTTTP
ncbi:MAG: hypothetical protein JWP12_2 [Bacteroidetes bacterium]|nr:hypothetical protein [Bacteroidota bacterium]